MSVGGGGGVGWSYTTSMSTAFHTLTSGVNKSGSVKMKSAVLLLVGLI